MNTYRVMFIGHREVEAALKPILTELLRTHEFVEFQLGRNGEFDVLAASCVKMVQKSVGNHNSALTLVLPYTVADICDYENYYDNIFYPRGSSIRTPQTRDHRQK